MLRLRTFGFLNLGAVLLTGCQPVASPLMGVFFNDTKFGWEATSNAAATKEGQGMRADDFGPRRDRRCQYFGGQGGRGNY